MIPAIAVNGLKKVYVNGFSALQGIDLVIAAGDFFSLLGPNGAGKSTFIEIVASLISKTAGTVKIFGHDLDQEPLLAKSYIGLVPQEINLGAFSEPQKILVDQAGYYGVPSKIAKARAEFYLRRLDLWQKRDSRVLMLSGGMKRRLMIARALMHEPKLLILDEPTAGVDIEFRHSIWDFLRDINAKGTTIILTTHNLEEAETLCRNVALIDRGQVKEQKSMFEFLSLLRKETLIFSLATDLTQPVLLDGYPCRLIDSNTLEIDVDVDANLSDLFNALAAKDIPIRSMRNKVNRLEELFLRLTAKENK